MPDTGKIYREEAPTYERLVEREDHEGNLMRALEQIIPLDGIDVVEFGAGTGRLTCMFAPRVKSIRAFDGSRAMLDVAVDKLKALNLTNWRVDVADHSAVPAASGSADLAIAGWTICYAALDHPDNWQESVDKALGEMKRVLRPGGTAIIIETQGTGHETPHPPYLPVFIAYLDYLNDSGFNFTWIRTDYKFESLAEAESLTRFFFGDELAAQVVERKWMILPECTGLWWKR
jgi:ubiquinone/menaquinone biosynthesis C-methylase UbiE